MGMFDTVLVKKKLLENVFPSDLLALWEDHDGGYFDFQTKDLDNILTTYYLEEDGKVYVRKWNTETEEYEEKNRPASELSQYVEFYTFEQYVGEENVWISFEAQISDGVVREIRLKDLEREKIADVEARQRAHNERWEKIRSTLEWRVYDFLQETEWFFHRLFHPLRWRYNSFKLKLKEKAEKKYPEQDESSTSKNL